MDSLQQFSRHVPQLLRHQILLDLVKEYLRSDISLISPSLSRGPSMQRFLGALLFIDISGFTVLSQKLDIESLKNNINDYFTKMLTIIQKWGGDVVKFAGDALYIVWQVREIAEGEESAPGALKKEESKTLDNLPEATFPRIMSSREAVDRATSCAAEICTTCSHYEVKIQSLDRRGSTNAFQYKSASANDGNVDDVTYLDVHAGLSFGTMAGINIGKETRWEYFLAGSPLADVAAAEEKAKKGDVVICKDAHALWHGLDDKVIDEDGILLCGCRLVEERFYFVSKTSQSASQSAPPTRTLRRKSSRLSRKEGMKDILTHGTRMHEDFTSEIELIYEKIRPMLELMYLKIVLGEVPVTDDGSVDALRQDFDYFYENDCRRKFSTWMIKAMTDELAKHVHDVERKNHAFHEPYLKERYYDSVHVWLQFDRDHRHDNMINLPGVLEGHGSTNSADQTTRELGVDLQSMLTETRLQKSQYHNVFGGNSSLAAEIFLHSSEKRSLVTVMFVKIESITIEINMYEGKRDHHDDQHLEKLLGFIPRSVQEYEEDSLALERLQRCFSVLCEAIYSTEGQLRQFIIDDKGTVCIATFGLMGSVSVDNAASAIACAEKIILGLEGIDLNARIGVTTGEAYCGVVGSSIRHEYAVMGPSTNLSARLMCRADIRSIICDETTYGQDRANKFILLDELKDVKGYSHPVKIFQPRSSVDLLNSNLIHDVTGKSVKTVRSAIITSKFVKGVYNVMKKVKKNVLFNAKIAKSKAKIREIYQSEFVFLCEDRMKEFSKDNSNSKRQVSEKKAEVYRKLYGRQDTIRKVFEAIIPSFGTIQNVIFEIDSLCRMVVIGSSVGGGKSAIISGISLKLQMASENDPQLNFFIVSDNTFSKLRLKATVPLSYWGFILFDLLKIVATNFQMTMDSTLSPQEQSRLRYLHTFDSLMQQFPEHIRDPKNTHLLLRLMKLDNSLGKSATEDNKSTLNSNNNNNNSSNHHFLRNELEILLEMIVYFVDLIPKIMNCAMILVLDDAHFLDSWSLKALHEVWGKVRGVCMILSFNPTQYHAATMTADHLIPQESFFLSSSTSMLSTRTGMRGNKPASLQDDIFSEYAGSERFEYIELPALKFEDTKLIAQDILGASVELNEAEFRQLFDISNGNPLYTVELIYAILAHGGRTENASSAFAKTTNKSMSSLSFDARGNVISTPTSRNRDLRLFFNKSKRLEEVIYYRLDQLHSRAQVLLKAASVAVSNGRSFSLELIYFMLDQNDLFPGPKVTAPARKKASTNSVNITSFSDTLDDRDNENNTTNNNDGYDSVDNEDMHLAEQIIPFLIEHKIFIRISQPKSIASVSLDHASNSATASSGSDKTTGALPPPRASQLMKEQEKLNKQVKMQQLNQARSQLLDENNTLGVRQQSLFDFDSIAMSHLPIDEYEDEDGDDDDYIPENIRSNKKKRSKLDMQDTNKPIVYYEFIAPIEQSTIYGLITDDQRKYFHERVASFYRESMLEMDEEEHQPEVVVVDIPGSKQHRGSTPVSPLPMTDGNVTNSNNGNSNSLSLPGGGGGGGGEIDTATASPSVTFNTAVQLAPSPSIVSVPSDDRWSGSDLMKGLRLKVSKDETPENLYEEAFHWEKANYWSTALRTYMRSAELEKERGNENRWVLCLQHALRVYKTIEHEFYQSELPLMPNQKLPYPELIIKILLGKHSKENDVVLYLKSVEKDMNHVWEIFEHDEELIPLVCSLHLALADAYLLAWATLGEIATMAGVALKLMLFLRYQEIFQKSHHHHHHHHSLHRRRLSHSGMSGYDLHNTSIRNMMHASHHSLPHVMSGYMSMNNNHSNVTTPHTGSSTLNMGNVSFNYKELFNTKSFKADPHHLISTLHIIHNTVMRYERPDDRDGTYYYYIAFKMGELIVDVDDESQNICLKAMKGLRQKDYVKVADTIAPLLTVSTAEFLAKSAQRVSRFGVDLLPSIVSELAQSFFLTQEKHRFHELLETPLYESLLRIPHLPSVENALLPLMVLFTYSEDFRLYRKMRSACKTLLVDRKNDLVLIQGMFQDIVQCWARSFLALYCPEDVPISQRDNLSLSSMMMGMEMAEKLFDSVQADADPEEREMSNVEVKSLLRYGAAMESLALQMICGLMLFVPTDGLEETGFDGVEHADAAASAAASGSSIPLSSMVAASPTRNQLALMKKGSLHAIVEQDEHEDSPRDALEKEVSISLDDKPGVLNKETSFQLRLDALSQDAALDPPTAAYVDDLFSRWWDRMFTDLYTLRYLHLLNILNPLLLLCRVLTKHQVNLTLPYTEARILLFFARFKTEIIHVCKKHKYLVTMEKFLAVEALFVERRKDRGGRVRTSSIPGYTGATHHHLHNQSSDNFYVPAASSGDVDEDYMGPSPSSTPTTSNHKHITNNNNNNTNSNNNTAGSSSPPVPLSKLSRPTLSRRTFTPQSLQEIIRTVERKSPSAASNTASPHHVRGSSSSSTSPSSSTSSIKEVNSSNKDAIEAKESGPRALLKRSLDSKTWNKNLEKTLLQDNEDDDATTTAKK